LLVTTNLLYGGAEACHEGLRFGSGPRFERRSLARTGACPRESGQTGNRAALSEVIARCSDYGVEREAGTTVPGAFGSKGKHAKL